MFVCDLIVGFQLESPICLYYRMLISFNKIYVLVIPSGWHMQEARLREENDLLKIKVKLRNGDNLIMCVCVCVCVCPCRKLGLGKWMIF